MKKIVILGNSIAGVKAAELIRSTDKDSSISIYSFDKNYPYDAALLCEVARKQKSINEIFYRPKDFYKDNAIEVVTDKEITRVNVNRKKIFFEDRKQVDYDVLLITDCPKYKFPDIKGANKEGIYGIERILDIQTIVDLLPVTETICIEARQSAGLQFALALGSHKKEVLLIVPVQSPLNELLHSDQKEALMKLLDDSGVTLLADNVIAEILGDIETKAVRLESGKIYASQMILFDSVTRDLRLYEDERLKMEAKIAVDASFRTSVENVFALDRVCQPPKDQQPALTLEQEGECVAACLASLDNQPSASIPEPGTDAKILK
ncbi:MAG: FAD-dependent oxidoreductase [Candidatus Omnitrophica bacterium]|nr:FAD-dependent oxidoreductase [Candidatus Omnitrophota bacterium]